MDGKHNLTSYILQIIIVQNALMLGWKVKKINFNKYELTKNVMIADDFNMNTFMDNLIKINE